MLDGCEGPLQILHFVIQTSRHPIHSWILVQCGRGSVFEVLLAALFMRNKRLLRSDMHLAVGQNRKIKSL